MSDHSICKTIKNLNLLDSFLFNELTENPENAKLIARIIIKRVLGWPVHRKISCKKKSVLSCAYGYQAIRHF